MLNHVEERQAVAVTLPKLAWLNQAPLENTSEIAAKFAEARIIKAGIESWQAITKAELFEGWKKIGRALEIGRTHALRASGANRPMGRNYCRAFSEWIEKHKFQGMPKSLRSVAIEFSENIAAIEQWRATLGEKERRRLLHPLSNVRRWRAATKQPIAKGSDDVAKAAAAWQRFVALMEALRADQAQRLWADVYEQAAQAVRFAL